jgi:hypothetical protein
MKKVVPFILMTLAPSAFAINFAEVFSSRDLDLIKSMSKTRKVAETPAPTKSVKKTFKVGQTTRPVPTMRPRRDVRTMESISTDMSSGISARKFLQNTYLDYYQQFLGPTLSGPASQTYNVYQEGMDTPRSGRAPLQSFHTLTLRHKITDSWGVGASIAAVNGYGSPVENRKGVVNSAQTTFFNTRMSAYLPSLIGSFGTFFTTLSAELPTSQIAKDNHQKGGWVFAETLAFALPSYKWSAGISGQVYRLYYENSQRSAILPNGTRTAPQQLQTMIVTISPYVNYRFNDKYQLGSALVLDWDQRGYQEGSREFNNNLPHRARVTGTYFPGIKYFSSVGVFAQSLVKFRPGTTAIGGEFALNF